MEEAILVKARNDHVLQWIELKRMYIAKRGSDAGRFGKAIPRTTNGDVAQLTNWWHNQFARELVSNPFAQDRDLASRQRWQKNKAAIENELKDADPSAVYPRNEWFWQEATSRLALYLQGRSAVPSSAQLVIESVQETVAEGIEAGKELAEKASQSIRDTLLTTVKTGAIIVSSVAAAAIVLPRVVRAMGSGKE